MVCCVEVERGLAAARAVTDKAATDHRTREVDMMVVGKREPGELQGAYVLTSDIAYVITLPFQLSKLGGLWGRKRVLDSDWLLTNCFHGLSYRLFR